ncbi:MAG: class I SAM-dependent methyltransferase [Chloroflexi bacterium]|nr:MAG: class I SAM-dependent methyltransferase [Chloroflexota bacterium]
MIGLSATYYTDLAVAYLRGQTGLADSHLLQPDELATLLAAGEEAGLPLHYFKRTMALARVRWALSVLRGVQPASLLDVGSGRGTFLWPLLDAFPNLPVTAIDADPQRATLLAAVQRGGVERLTAHGLNATHLPFPDNSFDAVTLLEVLEHIPDAQTALAEAVRVCRRALLLSVPSRPDDNPEHIHLFDEESLRRMLALCGVTRVKCSGVPGHWTALAHKE